MLQHFFFLSRLHRLTAACTHTYVHIMYIHVHVRTYVRNHTFKVTNFKVDKFLNFILCFCKCLLHIIVSHTKESLHIIISIHIYVRIYMCTCILYIMYTIHNIYIAHPSILCTCIYICTYIRTYVHIHSSILYIHVHVAVLTLHCAECRHHWGGRSLYRCPATPAHSETGAQNVSSREVGLSSEWEDSELQLLHRTHMYIRT